MLFAVTAMAQGMYQVGNGHEFNDVIKVAAEGRNLYIVDVNTDREYVLYQWDGSILKYIGAIGNMPLHGTNPDGEFVLQDIKCHDGKLYTLGKYVGITSSSSRYMVYAWNGNNWEDIAHSLIDNALDIEQWTVWNNNLYMVGYFADANLLKFNSNKDWEEVGNVMAIHGTEDRITDIAGYGNRLFASGNFMGPGFGQTHTTKELRNGIWEPVQNPPFLNETSRFALGHDGLMLLGKPNGTTDILKRFNGVVWDNVNLGLNDIQVVEMWDIATTKGLTCLSGHFRDNKTGQSFNFILGSKKGWKIGESLFDEDPIMLEATEGEIYAFGDFDFRSLSQIGEITDNASIISGQVYEDKNDNCVKDGDESGLPVARILISPGDLVYFTQPDGTYEIPIPKGKYTITFDLGYNYKYGCTHVVTTTVDQARNYLLPDLTAVKLPDVVNLGLNAMIKNGWKLVRDQHNEILLIASNEGTTTIKKAELSLKMGDWWEKLEIKPEPTRVEGDTYYWDVEDLKEGEEFAIVISGEIKAELDEYNDFCFTGDVMSPQEDVNNGDNRAAAELHTEDDIDPITKQSSFGSWYTPNETTVAYQIRFENELDQVINYVQVKDTFDVDLYPKRKALERLVLGEGAKSTLDIKNITDANGDRRFMMTWTSENANMAPVSVTDGSNVGFAWVEFYLHELSLKAGTELCNRAEVRFDNSEWLSTNTVCSKSVNLSEPPVDAPKSEVEMYPNPANDQVTLKNNSIERRYVEVYDNLGQLVNATTIEALQEASLDVSDLAFGVYFVKITGFETQRLVVH
jgi:hypothetical protein